MQSPLLGRDALPVEVTIDGRAFPIRHDFRDGIRFETLMFDASVPESTKVALAVGIWFGETTPDASMRGIIDAMLTFYRCGKPESAGDSDDTQYYSYTHDYDAIYAGFRAAYGIDLFEVESLHWWQFRAMLLALPEDCQFMRIVGYRAAKTSPGMSKEQRSHIRHMKRLFALPREQSMRPVAIRDEASYREALATVRAAKAAGHE